MPPDSSQKTGYVGVGVVTEAVQSANDFTVTTPDGQEHPAMEVLAHRDLYKLTADDPEQAEYFVKVDWLDKVPALRPSTRWDSSETRTPSANPPPRSGATPWTN